MKKNIALSLTMLFLVSQSRPVFAMGRRRSEISVGNRKLVRRVMIVLVIGGIVYFCVKKYRNRKVEQKTSKKKTASKEAVAVNS